MRITNKVIYSDKLTIYSSSFPNETDIISNYDRIINLSYEKNPKAHYHYPTIELIGLQGITTLYAIDTIFSLIDDKPITVLVHCDAGVNRSHSVVECFRYLLNGDKDGVHERFLLDIYPYLKRIEKREDIQEVIYSYIFENKICN